MSLFEAILLGLVQGITEFLPISSSGHLVIIQHFLPGFEAPGLLFDLLLHLGTIVAVCAYFRQDLKGMISSLFAGKNPSDKTIANNRKLVLLVVIGSVPTALIGLGIKDIVKVLFNQPGLAAGMLLVTAVLLLAADRVKKADRLLEQMGWLEAVLIGTIQGMAIIPGISRSGSTIAMGIYCKLDRELAARYSFLLMLPAVLGATLLEARHLLEFWQTADNIGVLLAGTSTAVVVGYFTIGVLMRIVAKQRLSYFAYYCIAAGLVTLLLV